MKSKLIPKCQNNNGNAFGNLGDNIDYQYVLDNLHTIPKNSEEYTLKESAPWLYQTLSEHAKTNHQQNRDFLKKSIEDLLKDRYYFRDFPEVEVVKNAPIRVQTYYPGSSRYPVTGHSQLKRKTGNKLKVINKTMDDPDYNLVTNNCANNSLDALNYTFGTQESPYFFVTPGDVQDFAKTLKGARFASDNSGDIIIPVSAKQARKYDEYVDWNNRRKYKQRKLVKKVQKEEDYKKAIALKQEYDKYTKGNPQKSPINEENKLTAR